MDFIIKYDKSIIDEIKIEFCKSLSSKRKLTENVFYVEKLDHLDYFSSKTKLVEKFAFGDIIKEETSKDDYSNSKGLFYLFTLNERRCLQIKPDYNSLLPIYYFKEGKFYYISSSFIALSNRLKEKTINKAFYRDLALFYTQLGNDSYYNEIKRLGYGEIIELNCDFKIKNINRFNSYFSSNPIIYNKSLKDIANGFIKLSKSYVSENCAIALTGGFDGRTLTGCAKYYKSDFINFSYGKEGSGDVDNPIKISQKLGLDYTIVNLDQVYLENDYNNCVESYIKYSGGMNGFQYPQSLYSVKKIGEKKDIIVTGYLGSEIFANAKGGSDEIYSQTFIDILQGKSFKDSSILNNEKILFDLGIFDTREEIEERYKIAEKYVLSLPKILTLNQKLALFSFEKVFRDTFGVWIYNGMHYAKIRAPFYDNEFLKKIARTEVSQFYRRFLEKNPSKRIYGQRIYSEVLKKVWPKLGSITSSKGYSPRDVSTVWGIIKIFYVKLKKSVSSEMQDADKLSTITGSLSYIYNNNSFMNDINIDEENFEKLLYKNNITRSLCFLSLSKHKANKLF